MRVFENYSEEVDGIATAHYRPAKPSEINQVHNAESVAKYGGAPLHTWNSSHCDIEFDRRDPSGTLRITINGQTAIVQRDELIAVIRYAKGSVSI